MSNLRTASKYAFIVAAILIFGLMLFSLYYPAKKIFKSPECEVSEPEYFYDADGTLIKIDYGEPCSYGVKSINYEYDNSGNLVRERTIIMKGGSKYFMESTYTYDPVTNELLSYSAPGYIAPEVTKDGQGRIIKEVLEGEITTYDYDELNRTVCVNCREEATGIPETYAYEGESDRITTKQYGTNIITQSFDEGGNLLSKSMNGKTLTYTYDESSSLTGMNNLGYFGSGQESLSYDSCGNMLSTKLVQHTKRLNSSAIISSEGYSDGNNYGIRFAINTGLPLAFVGGYSAKSVKVCLEQQEDVGDESFGNLKFKYPSSGDLIPNGAGSISYSPESGVTCYSFSLENIDIEGEVSFSLEHSNSPVGEITGTNSLLKIGSSSTYLVYAPESAFFLVTYDSREPPIYDENCTLLNDFDYGYEYNSSTGLLMSAIEEATGEITLYSYDSELRISSVKIGENSYINYYYDTGGLYRTIDNIQEASPLYCGDGVCNNGETAKSCEVDCPQGLACSSNYDCPVPAVMPYCSMEGKLCMVSTPVCNNPGTISSSCSESLVCLSCPAGQVCNGSACSNAGGPADTNCPGVTLLVCGPGEKYEAGEINEFGCPETGRCVQDLTPVSCTSNAECLAWPNICAGGYCMMNEILASPEVLPSPQETTYYLSPTDYYTMLTEAELMELLTACENENCGEIPTPWNCTDGIQNGFETGVDCGLSCFKECTPAFCNNNGLCDAGETYEDCIYDDCPFVPECSVSADCPSGETCVDGKCYPVFCSGDEDCPLGQSCQSGICTISAICGQEGESAIGSECCTNLNGFSYNGVLYCYDPLKGVPECRSVGGIEGLYYPGEILLKAMGCLAASNGADTNKDCVVSTDELISYIDRWLAGEASTDSLIEAIDLWITQGNAC